LGRSLEDDVFMLEQENDQLKYELDTADQHINSLINEVRGLTRDIDNLQYQNTTLKDKIKKLTKIKAIIE